MKITVYELLGLAKINKAPKNIKHKDELFELNEEYYSIENLYLQDNIDWTSRNNVNLNDEVEIIEEDKEITKWEGALEEIKTKTDYKIKDLQKYIEVLMETQNDIIDELNKLKGKSE